MNSRMRSASFLRSWNPMVLPRRLLLRRRRVLHKCRRTDQGTGRRHRDQYHRGWRQISILSDIGGIGRCAGRWTFKVAGTAKGVNAIQMDIKVGWQLQRYPADCTEAGMKAVSISWARWQNASISRQASFQVSGRKSSHDPGRQDPCRHRQRRKDHQ